MDKRMLTRLKKMQKDMQESTDKIELTEFVGRASGVVVVMQGTKDLLDVKIDPELAQDIESLQDAILLAVNDALNQIKKSYEDNLKKFTDMGGLMGF